MYHFLKQLIKISLFFFFRKIVVIGKENIQEKGPLIIVANHPNTLMDSLIIASITKQRIGFIANAGIFINKLVNAIFSYFNVIPIYRKKDIKPGEKPDNRKTFIKCHEYLENGGTFIIFPEGSSYYELKLRDIKTGTARIALSFEEIKNFKGNLKILPIALDYSDAIQFRSMISVTVNKPLSVSDYKEAYANNNFETVKKLSNDIRKELLKNIAHTSCKNQEDFLIKTHKFYSTYIDPKTNLFVNTQKSLELRTQISKAFNYLNKHNSTLYKDTQNNVLLFFKSLEQEGLTPGFFTDHFQHKNKLVVLGTYVLKFIIFLPLYFLGLLINYIPYILPSKIFEALNIEIEYKTSVEMVAGLLVFPLFYAVEIWLYRYFVSTVYWHSIILLVLFLISGYAAMLYYTELKRFSRIVRYYFFINNDKKEALLKLRNKILKTLKDTQDSLM